MLTSDEARELRNRTLQVVAVLVVSAAALWLLYQTRSVLFMAFVAVFVAVAFEPLVHALDKRGWRRGVATGVVFLAAFILIVVFVVSLIPLLVDQVDQLGKALPGYVDSFIRFVNDAFGVDLSETALGDAAETIPATLSDNWSGLLGGILGLGSTIFGGFVFLTTVALFAFYIVAELPQLQSTVLSFMNEKRQREALRIWDVAVEKMGGYIYSRLILAAIAAILTSVFLSLLGVPFAVPLGIWVGVLSQFIPVIGTYLAAVLPALVALAVDVSAMVWVVVFLVAYQQIENYVVAPRITRRTMSLHPAISIAAILIGGSLMGGIGIILALPMTAIIQAVISEWIVRHEVIDRAPPAEA